MNNQKLRNLLKFNEKYEYYLKENFEQQHRFDYKIVVQNLVKVLKEKLKSSSNNCSTSINKLIMILKFKLIKKNIWLRKRNLPFLLNCWKVVIQ